MSYPDLSDWNGRRPNEAEDGAVDVAERLAWSAIDNLTAGRVAFDPITVRPIAAQADGGVALQGPVGGVQQVRVDGVPFAAYRLEGDAIYRLDNAAWDLMNDDLNAVSTGAGVFEVTYFQGWRPGRLLVWAAGELASEFYKAASGQKCRLPKGTTSVVRQGVSFEIQKPIFTDGQTGILEVDVVLARYNPEGSTSQTVVASPESIARAPRRV